MVFFVLLIRIFYSNNTAREGLLNYLARLQKPPLKSLLINAGLSALIAFYSGYAGADILPTNIADTQVTTVNAVPVIDIARPSSSGVSKNQFNDFDVNSAGVVINNSLVDGTSSLAGNLGANANFGNKSARIILNEVVTTNTSDINGMTEFFGDDASYILSNPNGISCNGCGFIRTPTASDDSSNLLSEVIVTTGAVTVDNGKTTLTITVGQNSSASIVIGPGGLDASKVDVTSLFTRKAQIQGIINAANQLRLLAGTGTLEIENNVAPEDRTLTATQSDDDAVNIAIDATVAGAMNAGQIFIQATENGVGVTIDNDLISTSGDIEITADGQIRYKNASANGGITVSNTGAGSGIVASGDSLAAGDITWNLSGDGLLNANGDIAINAGGAIEFNCSDPICQIVSEHNIRFDASTLQTNATLVTNLGSDLTINAGVVSTNDIRSGDDLHISSFAGDINTAEIAAVNNINLQTVQTDARVETMGITATNGNIVWRLNSSGQLASTGALAAGGNMQFECVPSSPCAINASTRLTLNAQNLVTQADIHTRNGRDLTINANLDTDARINSGGHLLINAKDGDINTRGLLQAVQDIEFRSAVNRQLILDGGVISGGDLSIFGDGTYIHDSIGLFDIGGDWIVDSFGLNNNATLTITEFKDRTLFVKELDNNGLIQSNSSLELHVDELLNNNGVITSLEGVIQIKHSQAGGLVTEVNNNGIISSTNLSQNQQPDSSLIIDPQPLIDAHVAAILDGAQLSGQDLTDSIESTNQQAIADLTVDTNILGAVEIHAQTLNNGANGSISGSQILLDVGQTFNNGGLIVAGNNLAISGESITNQNYNNRFGVIAAHDNIDLSLTGQLTNTGIIEATNVRIDAPIQVNDNSGVVVNSLAGQTLDTRDYVETIGQLAWFSSSSDSQSYYQTIQVDGANAFIDSDLSLLTDEFLTDAGANLSGVPIVGDDVYLAELIAHTIRDSGGLPFVTEDRSNLLQLGTLYDDTLRYMAQTGLIFGEMPTDQQLQQLDAPVVVFNHQTLASNQVVYTPKLIMPQSGSNSNQLQAQQLFTQIIAYNELLLRSENLTNSASLIGGNRLVIETVDLTQTTTERNWYVDADGQVQYRSASIESPELVLSLSGDYVQEGGQIISQGQIYLEARSVEVTGVSIDGREVAAEIASEDTLTILAQERARYENNSSLISGSQTLLKSGADLNFGGLLNSGGNVIMQVAGDLVNQGNLQAGEDIVISARDILNTRGSYKLSDSTLINNESVVGRNSITVTTGRRQILDAGNLDAGRDIYLLAERDIIDTAGRYSAGGNISLLAKHNINLNSLAWQETEKLSEVYTRTRQRGKSEKEYTVTYRYDIGQNQSNKVVTGSLNALGSLNIQADGDVNLIGSKVDAGNNITLTGQDIALQAIETGNKKYHHVGRTTTRSSTIRNEVVELKSGGNLAIQAKADLTTYGSQISAGPDESGNIFINAGGATRLLGVNNEDYSYYKKTKKKSFGRKETWIEEGRNVTLQESELTGGGSLLLNMGVGEDGTLAGLESGKVLLEGSAVNMDGDAMLYSGDSLNILSGVEYQYLRREEHKRKAFGINKSGNISKEQKQRLGHATINTSGDTVLLSAGDINVIAGDLAAENIVAESGFGVADDVASNTSINILGDREVLSTLEHRYKRGLKFSIDDDFLSLAEEKHNKNWETQKNYIGSMLNARRDITLQTLGDIIIIGSEVKAEADSNLSAGNIDILSARDFYLTKDEVTIKRIGVEVTTSKNSVDAFAGLETTSITDEYMRDAVRGSMLNAGNQLRVDASGSILQRSGELVAGKGVLLSAGGNIDIEVDHSIETYNYEENTTRTGVSSGISHNYGSTKAALENVGQGDNNVSKASNTLQAIDAVDSFVSGPSVSGFAGTTSTTTRTLDTVSTAQYSAIFSGGEIQFNANKSIDLTGTWLSAEDDINLTAQDINISAAENFTLQASDFRSTSVGLNLQANKSAGSVGFGGSFSEQDIDSMSGDIQASMLRSGGNTSLNAIRDITMTASDIETGENLALIAGGDFYLGAQISSSDYQLDGSSGGAEFGIGFTSTSIGFYGSGNIGEEDMLRRGTTYRNSVINVGERLTLRSGEDTTLDGAVADAENVDLQVGGNLTFASLQDTGNADGGRYDANLRVTGGVGLSASGSVGKGSTSGTKAWVNQQTRLTGRESVSAIVDGHTQLDGAVLAADSGNLLLDTDTIGFSNIYDTEWEESDYLNVSFSTSGEQGGNPNQQLNNQATNQPTASGQQSDGSGGFGFTVSGYSSDLDKAQTNLATLGEGVVRIREDEEAGSNSLDGINRDVSSAQKMTKDNSEYTNFYISDSSLDSLGGMFVFDNSIPGEKNTFLDWSDDMGDYARSLYSSYRNMDELGKIESDSELISDISKAADMYIDAGDFLGTWTGGMFMGVENNGGLYGELPALVLGDQIFYRVRAPLITDENGKLVVDEKNKQILGQVDRPEENDYVFTNGVQNDMNDAIQKAGMQTGAVEFVVAYNPEHGFLGDGLEYSWDKYLGNILMSGNARDLRGFFQEGIDESISFSIAAHSQGAMLTYRAMDGLDFKNNKQITPGSILFSGAPVNKLDFYSSARDAGFTVSDKLSDTKAIFQVNRPRGKTSIFNFQLVDPVADMHVLLGGNGNSIDSLFSLTTLLGEDSPHSNYLCQGLACANKGIQPFLESTRKNYYQPDINLPPKNFRKVQSIGLDK